MEGFQFDSFAGIFSKVYFENLFQRKWISDVIIAKHFSDLISLLPLNQKQTFVIDSLFFALLEKNIGKLEDGLDLLQLILLYQQFYFPINFYEFHWTLFVVDFEKNELNIFDSIKKDNTDAYSTELNLVCTILLKAIEISKEIQKFSKILLLQCKLISSIPHNGLFVMKFASLLEKICIHAYWRKLW